MGDFWNNEFLVLNDQDKFNVFRSKRIPNNQSPVIILHHGGGHSALSWSLVAKKLISSQIEVIAYDARGHGTIGNIFISPLINMYLGSTINADEDDLSLERLSKDLFSIMSRLYSDETRSRDFILVGHSMGGPVVVDCVINHLKGFNILGVVLIDVVEGSSPQQIT
jgi:pimeloyl-ACP methyl ester carboxylesterase